MALLTAKVLAVALSTLTIAGATAYSSFMPEIKGGITTLQAQVETLKANLNTANLTASEADDNAMNIGRTGTAEINRLRSEIEKGNVQVDEVSANIVTTNADIVKANKQMSDANTSIATANSEQAEIKAAVNSAVDANKDYVVASYGKTFIARSLAAKDFDETNPSSSVIVSVVFVNQTGNVQPGVPRFLRVYNQTIVPITATIYGNTFQLEPGEYRAIPYSGSSSTQNFVYKTFSWHTQK